MTLGLADATPIIREQVHRVSVGEQKLALILHLPPQLPAPCVIACHGLGASKDSLKYLFLGREFPKAGLALCRFDFRGCGESDGAYAESTVASRIADLEAVLDFLANHPALSGRFGLLGSSMGGFVALHVAARRRPTMPVVTWNCPATLGGLQRSTSEDVAGLGKAFFDELATGALADTPAGVAFSLTIQADRDEVVPPSHGRILFHRAADPKELHILRDADHRLGDMTHRMEAVALSLRWLARYLS
ncbi:MAG: alpha/beta fold hydrolase [Candidatus Rokubacteria bacterium]|nr:alpha/beta fold hydrolase [Candidatus Rokubacteria bacterium]